MRARASHLRALLSRVLAPGLAPPPGRAMPQITGPGASRFGAAFLGRARFSSADASTAAQGGSKPPVAAAAATTTGGDGGGDGHSGKSEQADAGKSVRGGVSYGLLSQSVLYPPYAGENKHNCSEIFHSARISSDVLAPN